MSVSVSSWLVFRDKLCKDSLCLHDDVGSAPLWPSRLSTPYRRSTWAPALVVNLILWCQWII